MGNAGEVLAPRSKTPARVVMRALLQAFRLTPVSDFGMSVLGKFSPAISSSRQAKPPGAGDNPKYKHRPEGAGRFPAARRTNDTCLQWRRMRPSRSPISARAFA